MFHPQGFFIRFSCLLMLAGFAVTVICETAQSDDKAESTKSTISRRELTITPVAPPTPLLRYELLPPLRDRKPGNRAPYYLRALIHWESSLTKDARERFYEVFDKNGYRSTEFSPNEVRELLSSFEPTIRQLEAAVIRDHCDWNLDLEYLEGWDTISFSLEEFQRQRDFARLLLLKGRLEVVEGRFDDAIQTLQIGYQLARDIAEPPTLINSLIGIAITTIMNEVLVDWIDQPDAPNLYWALATRPQPFISMQKEFRFEANLPQRMFPVLRHPESAIRADAEWNRLVRELVVDLENIDNYWIEGRSAPTEEALEAADRVIAEALPIARRELLAAGFDEGRLDSMPEGQLLAIHTAHFVRERYDRFLAAFYVPPPQADRFIKAYKEESARIHASSTTDERRESLPVVTKLQPALSQAHLAWRQSQQRMDGLQCLEAIRAYTATHDGRLPARLDEITDTPCPVDVYTGRPFPYQRAEDSATLTAPPHPSRLPQTGREYILRIE